MCSSRRHGTAQRKLLGVVLLVGVFSYATPLTVRAQEVKGPSWSFGSFVKDVTLDPTTYAPAIIAYDATVRDWNSSQPFFRNGFLEQNARFTVSGQANDTAV